MSLGASWCRLGTLFLPVVGLGKRALRGGAIALAQPGLVARKLLFDPIDEHRDRRRADLERVAVPDHHVACPTGPEAADRIAQTKDFRRSRADRSKGLRPA